MAAIRQFFKQYRWALLSGVLMGTSYIPLPPWALFFCWVPVWLDVLSTPSLKKVFIKGWVSQCVLTLIGFHWIAYTAHEFGYFPWPLAILTLLLFATAMHLYIPLAMLLGRWLMNQRGLSRGQTLVLFACFHVVGEYFWPAIFPWNLGYPLFYAGLSIAQLADVVGVLGLSFLVHLLNAEIAWLIDGRDKKKAGIYGAVTVFALMFASYMGTLHREEWSNPDKTLKVLQVQANIGNTEKLQAEKGSGFQQEILNRFFRLTDEGLQAHPDTELVVWPETSFPDFMGEHNANRFYTNQFRMFVQKIQKPVLTGGYGNDAPNVFPRHDYNTLFLYGSDGHVLNYYFKTYLLVFGEYTPFGDLFPILKKWNPGGEGWGRGSGAIVISLNDIHLGPQICYEGLYPEFSRSQAQRGADLFVNITNDSWFGSPFEPNQHMYMTMARSIENRRPLIRATNTGITSAVLADGTVLQQSPIGEPWSGLFDIHYLNNPPLTFYSRFGFVFPLVIALIILITCVVPSRRLRRLHSGGASRARNRE